MTKPKTNRVMPPYFVWTPELEQKLRYMRVKKRCTYAVIGAEIGINRSSVRLRAIKLGLPMFKISGVKVWTPEQDEELTNYRDTTDLSYTEIALTMGYTKNKVIGRAHRLGLCSIKDVTLTPKLPRPKIPEITGCSYSFGHPGTEEFRFCNAKVKEGSSYCEEHHKLCYIAIIKKKPGNEPSRFVFWN